MLAMLITPLTVAADNMPLKPGKLTIAFVQRSFLGVNALDVEAALKILVREIGRRCGYDVKTQVQRFQSAQELESIPSANRPDLIMVDSWTYFDMADSAWLEPRYVAAEGGEVSNTYLLLTRRDKIKNLSELRGKPINLLTTTNGNLGIHWLSLHLQEHNLGLPGTFFSELNFSTDPIQAILPVFFGKKDAVVVDLKKFKLMTELNPQLGNLVPIASSEPLVNNIICLKRFGWQSEEFKRDVVRILPELHLEEVGRQTLLLFKIQKLEKFTPACLDTVQQMHKHLGPAGKNFLHGVHNP